MKHAHFVVQLDGNDRTSLGLKAFGKDRHHGAVPLLNGIEVTRVEEIESCGVRLLIFEADKNRVFVLFIHPAGNPFMLHLGHDKRSGTGNKPELMLVTQVNVVGDLLNFEDSRILFVNAPWNVGCDRIASDLFQLDNSVFPVLWVRPEVVNLAG